MVESTVQLRRASDASLDDDAVLLAMARAVLGGPRDDGRASYQVSLCVCPECGRGTQAAGGAIVPVGPAIVAMAACDAQQIGYVAESARVGATAAAQNATLDDGVPLDDGSPAAAETDAPAVVSNLMRTAHESDREASAHADRSSSTPRAHTGTRTTQTIPPALRRRVLARDHHRFRVPGCQNAAYLDLHHLQPRAEGGPNTAVNLILLCAAHHRGVHTGALVIEGQSAESLRFCHADGTPYGQPADPHALDVQAKVFSGLRNLGFRESDARAVLDPLRRDPTLASIGVRELMRAALERIALPRRGHC